LRFVIGEAPKNPNHNFEGYIKLDEPEKSKFMLVAGTVQFALWGLFFLVWVVFDDRMIGYFTQASLLEYLFILLLLIPVHELFHAMVYPLKNHKWIIFGVWLKMGVCYAMYEGRLTRDRWLLVYGMPILLISLVPFLYAIPFEIHPWVVIASILNAGLAAGDVLALVMILNQVPKRAVIVQDGWDTYWQPVSK